LLSAVIAAGPARAAACRANLAGELSSTHSATQIVTVVAPSDTSTTARLTLWQRDGGCWRLAAGPWTARVGRSGLSDHHREGDGTTPVGAFGVGTTVYGIAPDPGVHYAYRRLVCGDWWDEDPASPTYNRFRHVSCGGRPPFRGGSEALWLQTRAYLHFAVIDYNARPTVPGRGSAIFIHADVGTATNGCVSLPAGELDALLRWLRPSRSPLVVIGTDAEIRRF
jgi:L,D-peptidoglycan transpeptidase YkuD (ErfK/YbiS/YcfS/YnhG family)